MLRSLLRCLWPGRPAPSPVTVGRRRTPHPVRVVRLLGLDLQDVGRVEVREFLPTYQVPRLNQPLGDSGSGDERKHPAFAHDVYVWNGEEYNLGDGPVRVYVKAYETPKGLRT